MDKIELIKAEIERLKEGLYDIGQSATFIVGAEYAFREMLNYLNSLPEGGTENQEKVYQASEDLEKAAKEYAQGEGMEDACGGWEDMSDAFIAGAHWQKEQDIKLIQRTKDSWYKEGFVKGQIKGLSEEEKYQQGRFDEREQMMKGAQSAEIGYFKHSGLSILTDKSIERMPFKEGDKVKVIIVKEDRQ